MAEAKKNKVVHIILGVALVFNAFIATIADSALIFKIVCYGMLFFFCMGCWGVYKVDGKSKDSKVSKRTTPHYEKTKPKSKFDEWEDGLIVMWAGSCFVTFEYQDSNGDSSKRKVEVRKALSSTSGDMYLKGYCSKRNDIRTFKTSRIVGNIKKEGRAYSITDFLDNVLGI